LGKVGDSLTDLKTMLTRFFHELERLSDSARLPWMIIGIGIALRLVRYLHNPSLWFDESDIAIDLISRPFSDIINPSTDFTQAYPYVFLMLVKTLISLLGNGEYVLRLFPLLSGIVSLFLFLRVAKHFVEPKAVLIGLGLFAVSDSLVMQSSNLKPYSSDVAFTLLLYALAVNIRLKGFSIPRLIFIAVAGALIIWLSSPSVFVLAGIGICLGVFSFMKRRWSESVKLLIVVLIWSASFLANYIFYLKGLKAHFALDMEGMLAREGALMPIPPSSAADIKWFMDLFFDIFNNPLGMTLTGISALAFIIGLAALYSRQKDNFYILISPAVLAFLAAASHQYPFKGRFILFLLPLFLLVLAEGAEFIRNRTIQHSKIIAITFIALLFLHPISISAYRTIKPFYWEDIKPVLNYVKSNWQEDDILYVHYFAQYPFDYYSKHSPSAYTFGDREYIIGVAPKKWYTHWRKTEISKYYDPEAPSNQSSADIFKVYMDDLNKLKGRKRAWILFTESISKDGMNEEKFFTYYLDTIGKRLDSHGQPGVSSVYLYNLDGKPR
jgi:hypothetical protein